MKSASDFASKAIEGLSKAGHKPSKIINGVISFCNGVKSFVKNCFLIPGKIKTKVTGWIDSAKGYVSNLFEKAVSKIKGKISGNVFTENFLNWLEKGAKDNTVYFALGKDGKEIYVGITKQDVDKRLKQHILNDKPFEKIIPQHTGLTRNQARSLEQYYIKHGPNEFNIINSINENTEFYAEAEKWALKYLGL